MTHPNNSISTSFTFKAFKISASLCTTRQSQKNEKKNSVNTFLESLKGVLVKMTFSKFKGWNQLNHQPGLKFPYFFPASLQAKTAGISKWLMIRLVPSFKLKTKNLYK